ncbi:LUD domain-containing protein [Streptomyces luteolus]|uniref:LUD domain-containing protein n=1 Tax=Streptomyces luteolus TaxID=3043615 RepID=A0ABT6T4L9_9ACTN|nr:LUD domain-containing protein [Streptomyces sp. B-S-A12]MDI3422811.1 LUD domain-containing protein [Streptomyces sp. B-S-A12]
MDYRAAQVHTCTADRTAEVLADVLRERGVRSAEGRGARGARPGLARGVRREVREDAAEIPAPQLDALDGVVTASAVGCAGSGTIFLDGFADQGRRALSLVPDLHVCVVDLSSVEAGVPDAVVAARAAAARAPDQRAVDHVRHRAGTRRGVRSPRVLDVVIRADA